MNSIKRFINYVIVIIAFQLMTSSVFAWRSAPHEKITESAINSISASAYPDIIKFRSKIIDWSGRIFPKGIPAEMKAHNVKKWDEFIEYNDGDVGELWAGKPGTDDGMLPKYKSFDFSNAYEYIGSIAHLIEDMASPPHAANIVHGLYDGFERYSSNKVFPYVRTPIRKQEIKKYYEESFLQTYSKLPTWFATIPQELVNSTPPWPAKQNFWVRNPLYDGTVGNRRHRGHYGGGPNENLDIYYKTHYAKYTGLGGETITFPVLVPGDGNIVITQANQAVELVAGMLQTVSEKLPPLVKDLSLSNIVISKTQGTTISFKILENRRPTVKIFIYVDTSTNPIISSIYGTGNPFTLTSDLELPYTGNFSVVWDGKLADGSYPSDAGHTLYVRVQDEDGNFSDIAEYRFAISQEHIQTTQTDWQSGILENIDTTSSPGAIKIADTSYIKNFDYVYTANALPHLVEPPEDRWLRTVSGGFTESIDNCQLHVVTGRYGNVYYERTLTEDPTLASQDFTYEFKVNIVTNPTYGHSEFYRNSIGGNTYIDFNYDPAFGYYIVLRAAETTQIYTNFLGTHTYRMVGNASTSMAHLYIDGIKKASVPFVNGWEGYTYFNIYYGVELYLDYVAYTQGAYSPSELSVLGGILGGKGTYTSQSKDVGYIANWDKIVWTSSCPAGTEIILQTRTGNTLIPDTTNWSLWSAVLGTTINSPSGRYIQKKAILKTNKPCVTPVLSDINITYHPDVTPPATLPQPTVIPGTGYVDISWPASPELDTVGYNIYKNGNKINPTLVTTLYYQDTNVVNGVTYEYAVTSVDYAGNESAFQKVPVKTTPKGEFIPPSAITDLKAETSITPQTINLFWTATGDDGTVGQIAEGRYEIKYSTDPLLSTYQLITLSTSTTPGENQFYAIAGLISGATYYFSIWIADEWINWSNVSNPATAWAFVDSIPPSKVEDLSVASISYNSITLIWTAPGDDGTIGTATSYDVRYSLSQIIDDITFATAIELFGEPEPYPAGTQEIFLTRAKFTPGTTYYFALKTIDDTDNISLLSNCAVATVPKPPILTVFEFKSMFGTKGSGDGEFQNPIDIDIDRDGNVYVADYFNSRVQKFTSDGLFITKWGNRGSGPGQFGTPTALYGPRGLGVATDGNGVVYVGDTSNYRVEKFTSDGTFLAEWDFTKIPELSQYPLITKYPVDIAVDSVGDVYVTAEGRLIKFDSNGNFLAYLGGWGCDKIAIDSENKIYVTIPQNNKVLKLTTNGELVTQWGTQGSGDGQLNSPRGIAVDFYNNVYVADNNNHRVQVFDNTGNFITKFGTFGEYDRQMKYPEGVGVNKFTGDVYVADLNNRIQIFAVDVTTPSAPVITSPGTNITLTTQTPFIWGKAEPLSKVSIYDGGILIGTTTADIDGKFKFIPTIPLSIGSHIITATATDAVAHTSVHSVDLSLKIEPTNPISFAPAYNLQTYPGWSWWSINTEDFNNDGLKDIVAGSGGFIVLLGKSGGVFEPKDLWNTIAGGYAYVVGAYAVITDDFNKDGNTDIAFANTDSKNNISVYQGLGDGTFVRPPQMFPVGQYPLDMVKGDFNKDGNTDIATVNYYNKTISVLLGSGDGTFITGSSVLLSKEHSRLSAGDFNKDGITDLVAVSSSSIMTVLLGNGTAGIGDGTFRINEVITTPGCGSDVAVGDFNQDGILDLAVPLYPRNTVLIYTGNGDGTFETVGEYSNGLYSKRIALGDYNADSILDIATANWSGNNVSVLLGLGDGTFSSAVVNIAVGPSPSDIVADDFNQDGLIDLAVANYGSSYLSVILNGTTPPDRIFPANVTDLAVSDISSSTVTLTWTAPGDDGAIGNIVGGKYKIVYANVYPITSTEILWSTNTIPGTKEAKTITGLANNTTYWFYIQTCDEAGNWSGPSNTVSTKTYAVSESTEGIISLVSNVSVNIVSTSTVSPDVSFALSTATAQGLYLVSNIYDITPAGTVFSPPAEFTFKYDPAVVIDTTTLAIYKWTGVEWSSSTITNQVVLDAVNPRVVGYMTSVSYFGLFIRDIQPPRTTSNIGQPIYENYVSSATEFGLSAVDDLLKTGDGKGVGVKETKYKIDDGDWQIYSDSFTISEEGLRTISYYSYDVIGNTEATKSFSVIVDTSAPSTILSTSRELFVKDNIVYATDEDYFTLSSTDTLSGVREIRYWMLDAGYLVYEKPFNIFEEGKYKIGYYAIDNVQNAEGIKTYTVVIDTTPPKFTNIVAVPPAISTGTVEISFEGSEPLQKNPTVLVNGNPAQFVSYTSSYVCQYTVTKQDLEGRATIHIEGTDYAGNIGTDDTGSFIIDYTPPVTSITSDEPKYITEVSTFVTADTFFTLTSTDNISGVRLTEYKINEEEWNIYGGTFTLTGGAPVLPEIPAGCVALWKFDEGSGSVVYDASGNGNHGAVSNTSWVDGKINKCLSFNGSARVTIPETASIKTLYRETGQWREWYYPPYPFPDDDLPNGKAITIEAFVKRTDDRWTAIIDKGGTAYSAGGWALQLEGGKVHFGLSSDRAISPWVNTELVVTSKQVPLNEWTHIAATWSKADKTMRVYINGEQSSETAIYDSLIGPPSYSEYRPVIIGNKNHPDWAVGYRGFAGLIDEVGLYNRELTPQEVQQRYTGKIAVKEGPYTIFYKSIDNLDNAEETKSETVILDATPPKTEFSLSGNFVNIDPNGNNESGIMNYELLGSTYSVDGSTDSVYVPPGYQLVYSTNPGHYVLVPDASQKTAGKWINFITSETELVFTSSDTYSGVKISRWQIADSGWQEYTSPFTLSGNDGLYVVRYRSEDNLGHIEVVKSSEVYLDNTAPTSRLQITNPKYQINNTIYVSTKTQFTITADDGHGCGVKISRWQVANSIWQDYYSPFTLSDLPEGEHTITYYSEDLLGNVEQVKTQRVILDKTPPETALQISNPKYQIPNKTYVTSQTSFTFIATDNLSGVKKTKWKIDDGGWFKYKEPFNLSGLPFIPETFELPDGCVGLWKFDEGGGNVATDGVGTNNGTIYGASWVEGIKGSALSFDGVNDGVNFGNSPTLSFNGAFSIEMWLKPQRGGSGYQILLAKGIAGYNHNYIIHGWPQPDDTSIFEFACGGNTGSARVSSPKLQYDEWTHMVMVYGGLATIKLYVNGVFIGEQGNIVGGAWTDISREVWLGHHQDYPSSYAYKGLIDEVAIYNRALTEEEIAVRLEIAVPVTELSEGEHTISYYSIDNVKNKESVKTQNIVLDDSPPEIIINSPKGGEKFVATIDKINIDFMASDLSPLTTTGYLTLVESPKSEVIGQKVIVNSGDKIEPLDLPYYGFYTMTVEATDCLGHYSSSTTAKFEVIWDIKPPQSELEVGSPKYEGAITYITSTTPFNLSAIDDLIETEDRKGLGVKNSHWSIVNSQWTIYTNPEPGIGKTFYSSLFTLHKFPEGKHTINYFSEDILGNKEEVKEKRVIIDNTAPVSNYYMEKILYENHPTNRLVGNTDSSLTIYSALSNRITLSATDIDQNLIYNSFDKFKIISGSWTVTDGKFTQMDNNIVGYTRAVLELPDNWKEYNLDVKLKISSFTHSPTRLLTYSPAVPQGALVYFNYQDEHNWYGLYLSERNKIARVIKYENGIENILADVNYPVELNRWYDIQLQIADCRLQIKIFGEKIFDLPLAISHQPLAIGMGSDLAIVSFSNLRLVNIPDFPEISLGSGLKDIYYSIDDQPQFTYYSPLALTEGRHTIRYHATDNLTNTEPPNYLTTYVDGTPPDTEFHSTEIFYKDLYVSDKAVFSLTAEDPVINDVASGIFKTEYSIDSSPYALCSMPSALTEGKHTVQYYSLDNVENKEETKTKEIWVDGTAPESRLTVDGLQFIVADPSVSDRTYINPKTKIIFSAEDQISNDVASGVSYTEYRIDSQSWQRYSESFTLKEGIRKVEFRSTDNVGNIERIKNKIFYVDDTAPESNVSIGTPKYISDNQVYVTSKTTYTLTVIDPTVKDVSSGVRYAEYSSDVSGWEKKPAPITDYQIPIVLPEDIRMIFYRGTDNVDNKEQTKSLTVYVDNTAPISQLTVNGSQFTVDGRIYIASQTSFTISAIDPVVNNVASGVSYTEYRILRGDIIFKDWQKYEPFTIIAVDGIYTIEYRSYDSVTNLETTRTQVVYLDNTAPQTNISAGSPQYINSDGKIYISPKTSVSFSATDPVINEVACGVSYTEYRINGSQWFNYIKEFYLEEGIRKIEYRSYDNLLNEEQIKSQVYYVDNTAPISSLQAGEPSCTIHGEPIEREHPYTVVTSNTPITVSAQDPLVENVSSGVRQTFYSIGDLPITDYRLPITLSGSDGDYHVSYYSVDNVHNTEQTKTATLTFDNTPPQVEILLPSKDATGLCKIINGQVSIYGSATDLHFKYYQLFYAPIDTNDWKQINDKTYKEIKESVLTVWDTTQISEGWYTIKLLAQDCVKNESSTTIDVYVGKPELLLSIGKNGKDDGEFISPSYIVLDSTGNFYVSDTNNDRIQKFDKDGNFLLEIKGYEIESQGKGKGQKNYSYFNKPTGVAVDSQGNLYVADRNNNRVVKLSTSTQLIFELKGFNKPHGLFIDKADALYVADRNNDRIQKFNSNGNLIMTLDTGLGTSDNLNKPQGVMTVDTEGRIYITDRNNDRILIYNSIGGYITQITSATTRLTDEQAGLNKPDGIYVNSDGYIFVSDTNNDRVVKLAPEKYNYILIMSFSGFNKPAGLTFDDKGNLYVVDSNNSRIEKFGLPSKPKVFASSPISQSPNLSISDFKLGEIYAYPNPAKRGKYPTIHIEVGVADKVEIRIYNIAAELVHSAELYETSLVIRGKYAYEHTWDISNIASGVYIYVIRAKKNGFPDIKAQGKCAIIK